MARLRPWWKNCQWSAITYAQGEWKEIYSSQKRSTVETDAKAWRERMRLDTKVVPGPGHKHFRERTNTERGFKWTPQLAMAHAKRKRR